MEPGVAGAAEPVPQGAANRTVRTPHGASACGAAGIARFEEWTDLPIDRDQLLTTVALYWFTRSGATAAHALYEQAHSSDWGAPPDVPHGFAVFGADETVRKLVPAPPDAHWTEFERGKHFPAMEASAQLAADLRAFFGPLK